MSEDEKKRPRPLLDARALLDLSDVGGPPPPTPTRVEQAPLPQPTNTPLPRGASEMLPFEPLSTESIFSGRALPAAGVTTTRSMELPTGPAPARLSPGRRALLLLLAVALTAGLGVVLGIALAPSDPAPPASSAPARAEAPPRIVAQAAVATRPPPEPSAAPSPSADLPAEPEPTRAAPRRALAPARRASPSPNVMAPTKAELSEQLRAALEAERLDWTDLSALDELVVRRWRAADGAELEAARQAVQALIVRAAASPAVISARLARVLARLQALPPSDPRRVPLEDRYLELKSMLESHPSPERARRLRQQIQELEGSMGRGS